MKRMLLAVIVACPASVFAQVAPNPARVVTVSGSGSVEVTPDVAQVSYSFTDELRLTPNGATLATAPTGDNQPAKAKTATDATLPKMVEKNKQRVEPAVAYIKSVIGDKGTVEVMPSVQPQYEYNEKNRRNEKVGYKIVTSVSVKLRSKEAIEQKLSSLFDSGKIGADEMGAPSMSLDEKTRKDAERTATRMAVQDAVATAEAQLEPGEQLGVALQRGDRINVPTPRYEAYAARALSADAAPGGRSIGSAAVETGKVTVQSMINFVFEVTGTPTRMGVKAVEKTHQQRDPHE